MVVRKFKRIDQLMSYCLHITSGHNLSITTIFNLLVLMLIGQTGASTYVEQYLTSPEICPPYAMSRNIQLPFDILKEKIKLGNFPNKTVVLKFSRWQERNTASAHLNFGCTFKVTAPKGYGVTAAIKTLYLRTYSQQASCRDSIRFKPEGGMKSPQICGEVTGNDLNEYPEGLIGPRSFYDPKAALDVIISTADASMNDSPKPLLIELVLTATQMCPLGFQNGAAKIRECVEGHPLSCIPSSLFCDGYVNCGFERSFGSDEEGCEEKEVSISRALTVFIFVMTALCTLAIGGFLLLFICCCCRKCKKKEERSEGECGRVGEGSQNSSLAQDSHLVRTLNTSSTDASAPSEVRELGEWTPSTPKSEVIDVNEDDLPPSYKDLFPGRVIN